MVARSEDTVRALPKIDLGHTRVDNFLNSIRRGRVPSLLFSGPEGSGKEYTAVEFARKLCCGEKEPCEPGGSACESCTQAALLEHPGINLIYPTPTQGSGETEEGDVTDIGKILEEKRQDIFSRHQFTKKASIRIARARAVIQRANTKPFGSPYNVFIFMDAHAMREEAQNALLKVVEEPPPHGVLILVTNNPESILFTIRSRCQQVRFTPLKTAALERILTDYYGVDEEPARRSATLAQGNVQRARNLIASFDDAESEEAAAFVAGIAEAPESWVIGQAMAVGRGSNRDGVARYLHELALIFRDVMAGEETLFINSEKAEMLTTLTTQWDRKKLPKVIDRIARARYEILFRNLNVEAALVDLFLDIRRGL